MKIFFLILLIPLISFAQKPLDLIRENNADVEIRKVLDNQIKAWNNGDVAEYMNGYWKNDSLKFIGKNGIQYGWQTTLDNYKKSYPDKATMGILSFDVLSVELLSDDDAFVIGKWKLVRVKGKC